VVMKNQEDEVHGGASLLTPVRSDRSLQTRQTRQVPDQSTALSVLSPVSFHLDR